jgi:catechol 2,3-dioxygenase-like lactoylglutathione lyase family enzyme
MLNHLSIGVADLVRSGRFYDVAFKPLGYTRLSDGAEGIGYGTNGSAVFWIMPVASPVPRDDASGLHICFDAPSRNAVDAFHAAALESGGSDNGKPGLRPEYHAAYYAAFVVDPDGYRIEAYCCKH